MQITVTRTAIRNEQQLLDEQHAADDAAERLLVWARRSNAAETPLTVPGAPRRITFWRGDLSRQDELCRDDNNTPEYLEENCQAWKAVRATVTYAVKGGREKTLVKQSGIRR